MHLKLAALVAGIGVQEHVDLLVRPGRYVRVDAVLGGPDAPAGAQERKAVQVLEPCMVTQPLYALWASSSTWEARLLL